jgi:hypothetical protein
MLLAKPQYCMSRKFCHKNIYLTCRFQERKFVYIQCTCVFPVAQTRTLLGGRVARWYVKRKNLNLGKFLRVKQWNMLVYFMDIWSILRPFDVHIVWPLGIF